MKIAPFPAIGALIVSIALSGCASIISGSQQSISVVAKTPESADVAGAACSFTNGKGQWFAPAPGSVTVHRAYGALVVHCDHPEWIGDFEARSTTKGMAFGNLLFGGVIGVGVDVGTGAAYDYPQLITVPMKTRVAATPAMAAGGAPPAMSVVTAAAAAAAAAAPQSAPIAPAPVASSQPVPAVASSPSAVGPLPAAPVASRPAMDPPSAATTVAVAVSMSEPAVAVAPVDRAMATRPVAVGQDEFSASRLAKDMACHSQPVAVMTSKGPGFENYSVACVSGDALAIRCQFGNCHALRR